MKKVFIDNISLKISVNSDFYLAKLGQLPLGVETSERIQVDVFPNPIVKKFSLKVPDSFVLPGGLHFYGVDGLLRSSKKIEKKISQFSVDELPSGVCILMAEDSEQRKEMKRAVILK